MFLFPSLNATNVAIEMQGQGSGSGVRPGPRSRSGSGEIINFRGLNASIFVIFFFNGPRISRGFHFFALECSEMNC